MGEFLQNKWVKACLWLSGSGSRRLRIGGVALSVLVATAAFVVFAPHPVMAQETAAQKVFGTLGEVVFLILARVFQSIAALFGSLVVMVVGALISIAQYNDFVNAPAVATGWMLVRDITNMFYIMVMLLIAFGTMLGIDQYSYKNKTVTKLLIAAVIVNFSRTFCGLLIDFAQVVMLTFVYGFAAAGGGNFLDAVGLNTWLSQNSTVDFVAAEGTKPSIAFNAMLGMALAAILAFITLVVVIYMTVCLVIRIIYLWLLVVMSPAAFFLRAVPLKSAEKYYGEWWGEFTGQVIFGPLMAFFLWLSLATVAQGNLMQGFNATPESPVPVGMTEAFTFEEVRKFIIAIGLLVGGTSIATKVSGKTAGIAKKAMSKGGGFTVGRMKWAGRKVANTGLGIPFTNIGRDKTTGERITLAGLGGAYGKRLQMRADKSGLARFLGLQSKDRKEDIAAQQQLASFKNAGLTNEAAALEKQMVQKGAETLGKKYSPDQLKKIVASDTASQLDRQRAMLALAQKGDESLKGLGLDLGKEIGKIGGSADFEMQVREALKAKGDEDAMLKKPEDVKKIMDRLVGARAKAQELSGIFGDVQPRTDGTMRRRAASNYLLALDKESYEDVDSKGKRIFSNKQQKEIKESLMLAAHYDKANSAELKRQYKDLMGADMDDTEQQALVAAAEGKRAEARAGLAAVGQYSGLPIDRAAQTLFAENNGSQQVVEAIKNLQAQLAAGATPAAMAREFSSVIGLLDGIASDSTSGDKIASDQNGKPIGNDQAIKDSDIYKDVTAAAAAGDAKEAANRLKTAYVAIEDALTLKGKLNTFSQAERDQISKSMTQGRNSLGGVSSGFGNALTMGSDKEKIDQINRAAAQGVSTVVSLLKQNKGTLAPSVTAELESLKSALKGLKSVSEMTTGTAASISALKSRLDKVAKQV